MSPTANAGDRFRSRRPARQVPRGARQAPARRCQRTVRRSARATSAVTLTIPMSMPGFTREPLSDDVECWSSAAASAACWPAARLREAGVDDIRIIEKGGDFGGTWYWNRYPGAQCDIEIYIYLPLLEETGYIPKEKYSYAPEIFEHSQRIGEAIRSLRPGAVPDPDRTVLRWNEDDQALARQPPIAATDISARFVVMSNGPLNRPKLPGIPGIDRLQGPHLPHQPLGLRLHRRRHHRRTCTSSPTSGWRSSAPARPRSSACRYLGKARAASLRLPAHAVVGRRARQRADRSGMGEDAGTRLAEAARWTTSTSWSRVAVRTRTWSATAGPTSFRNLGGLLPTKAGDGRCRRKSARE